MVLENSPPATEHTQRAVVMQCCATERIMILLFIEIKLDDSNDIKKQIKINVTSLFFSVCVCICVCLSGFGSFVVSIFLLFVFCEERFDAKRRRHF